MTTNGIFNMLNEAPYGAYAVDMSQTISFWNRSAERILGFKADQVIGCRCYVVLQILPEEGSTPVCMEGCPAIQLARGGCVPPVVRVRMRCVSGHRKLVTVTPLIVPEAQTDRTWLVHLFHDQTDDMRARKIAGTVLDVLSKGKSLASPTDLIPAPLPGEASALTAREATVLACWPWDLAPRRLPTSSASALTPVRNHVRNAREKMQETSKLGAVLAAQRRGLL